MRDDKNGNEDHNRDGNYGAYDHHDGNGDNLSPDFQIGIGIIGKRTNFVL